MEVVQIIQAMLAPGILISACGLFLLGMNNKYSLVVGRIRTLDEELRKLDTIADTEKLTLRQQTRYQSIKMQVTKFYYRIKLVRNAVVSYSSAVFFFVATCLGIGLQFAVGQSIGLSVVTVILFLLGLLCLLSGICFAVKEVLKGFEIVGIEVANEK
jgi:hypothetical protein